MIYRLWCGRKYSYPLISIQHPCSLILLRITCDALASKIPIGGVALNAHRSACEEAQGCPGGRGICGHSNAKVARTQGPRGRCCNSINCCCGQSGHIPSRRRDEVRVWHLATPFGKGCRLCGYHACGSNRPSAERSFSEHHS